MTFFIFQKARFVAVRKNGNLHLQLGEVKVFATCPLRGASFDQALFVKQQSLSQKASQSAPTDKESFTSRTFESQEVCAVQCSTQHGSSCDGFYFNENDGRCSFKLCDATISPFEGQPQWTKYL